MTQTKRGLIFGSIVGMLLVVLGGWANYGTYVAIDHDYAMNTLTLVEVMYFTLATLAAIGFIQYGMILDKRDGLTGTCLGVLATTPIFFIALWYSAHLAHLR